MGRLIWSGFGEWVCIFPGKMGLSWKLAHNIVFNTREEAEVHAAKTCNVAVVPAQLYRTMKEHECRMVAAEAKLIEVAGLRLDYTCGQPVFVEVSK